jgi:hypothetical protein
LKLIIIRVQGFEGSGQVFRLKAEDLSFYFTRPLDPLTP